MTAQSDCPDPSEADRGIFGTNSGEESARPAADAANNLDREEHEKLLDTLREASGALERAKKQLQKNEPQPLAEPASADERTPRPGQPAPPTTDLPN